MVFDPKRLKDNKRQKYNLNLQKIKDKEESITKSTLRNKQQNQGQLE